MNNTTTDETNEDFDPQRADRLISETQRSAEDALQPDSRLVYLVWTVAWPVAMISAWLGVRPGGSIPMWVGMTIYFVAIGVAVAVTVLENSRKVKGVGGRSVRLSQLWGTSWIVGWIAFGLLMVGLGRLPIDGNDELLTTMGPVMATFVVGAMYLQGGAFWPRSQMIFVGWMLLIVAGGATLFGPVNHYLVLGIGGAVSFGVGAWRTSNTTTSIERAAL